MLEVEEASGLFRGCGGAPIWNLGATADRSLSPHKPAPVPVLHCTVNSAYDAYDDCTLYGASPLYRSTAITIRASCEMCSTVW